MKNLPRVLKTQNQNHITAIAAHLSNDLNIQRLSQRFCFIPICGVSPLQPRKSVPGAGALLGAPTQLKHRPEPQRAHRETSLPLPQLRLPPRSRAPELGKTLKETGTSLTTHQWIRLTLRLTFSQSLVSMILCNNSGEILSQQTHPEVRMPSYNSHYL